MKTHLKLLTLVVTLFLSNQVLAAESEDIYGGCEHGKCNVIKAVLSNGMHITRDVDGASMSGSFSLSGSVSLKSEDNNKNFIDSLRRIAAITSLEVGEEITEEARAKAKAKRDAEWAKWREETFGK